MGALRSLIYTIRRIRRSVFVPCCIILVMSLMYRPVRADIPLPEEISRGPFFLTTSGSPYLIETATVVTADATLYIGPDVEVHMADNASLHVYGGIQVSGKKDAPVVIKPHQQGGRWGGVSVVDAAETVNFSHVHIEGASVALDITNSSVIVDSVLIDGAVHAVKADQCTMAIRYCFIRNCSDTGITADSWSQAKLYENIITNCSTGIAVHGSSYASIEQTTCYGNRVAIACYEMVPGSGGGYAAVINTVLSGSATGASYITDGMSTFDFSYSLSDSDMLFGTGNIFGDPLYADPAQNNFVLLPDSPCIDSGNPESPLDTDGSRADMGVHFDPQRQMPATHDDNGQQEGCFIATAAFGSPLVKHVCTLSKFRDEFLLKTVTGRRLVERYYAISPFIANCIVQNGSLQQAVRSSLFPLIALAHIYALTGVWKTAISMGAAFSLAAPFAINALRGRKL